jgi:hypothetical protein
VGGLIRATKSLIKKLVFDPMVSQP